MKKKNPVALAGPARVIKGVLVRCEQTDIPLVLVVTFLAGACTSAVSGSPGDLATREDAQAGGPGGSAGQGGASGSGGHVPAGDARPVGGADASDRPSVVDATSEGGFDAGPINAGPCTALICEDFEKGVIDKTIWAINLSGVKNSVVLQSDRFAHGRWALKSHVQDNSPQAFLYYKKVLPPALSTHLFGRAYMYLTGYPTGHNLLGWVSDNANVFAAHLLEFGAHDKWHVLANFDRGFMEHGTVSLDRWMCVEWEFTGLPQDQMNLWIDGKAEIAQKNIGNGSPDTFVSFGVGQASANGGADKPLDVYVDDVAIDVKRIGCLP